MKIFIISMMFCCQAIPLPASGPANPLTHFYYPEYFKKYSVKDWEWMSQKLDASAILNETQGNQRIEKIYDAEYILTFLATIPIPEEAIKTKLRNTVIAFLQNFLSNPQMVELMNSEERKTIQKKGDLSSDGKRYKNTGRTSIDLVLYFPYYIIRAIASLEPNEENIAQCQQLISTVTDAEYREKYSIALLECLIRFSRRTETIQILQRLETEISTAGHPYLQQLRIADCIRRQGLNAAFSQLAVQLVHAEPMSIDDFNRFMINASNGFSILPAKEKEDSVETLFQKAETDIEKLLIIRIGLLSLAPPGVDTQKMNVFLKEVGDRCRSDREKMLYYSAVDALQCYQRNRK